MSHKKSNLPGLLHLKRPCNSKMQDQNRNFFELTKNQISKFLYYFPQFSKLCETAPKEKAEGGQGNHAGSKIIPIFHSLPLPPPLFPAL